MLKKLVMYYLFKELLFITILFKITHHETHPIIYNNTSIENTQKKVAYIDGDMIIGALFPIHQTPLISDKHHSLKCGNVWEQYGIQRVEVALRTVDHINRSPNILPTVKLGIEIRDSCYNPSVALHQSLTFLQKLLVPQKITPCKLETQNSISSERIPQIIGIVGPASSEAAMQVYNLLQPFHIAQVGYSTTSSDLSDKKRFNNFFRVVPSDYYQALVMIRILQVFEWTYVNAIHTEGNYGQSGIQNFKTLADENNICIATEQTVQNNAKDENYDAIIKQFQQEPKAKIIICFCEGYTIRELLKAVKRMNKFRHFIFIGSDGWAGRDDVVKNIENVAQGNIMIRIHTTYVSEFDPYYFKLSKVFNQNKTRNPWFKEFWENRFKCKFKKFDDHPICTGKEDLKSSYHQDPKLSFVIKSIYFLANSLHNFIEKECEKNVSITNCASLYPSLNRNLFMEYLRNASFKYERDELVKFDRKGDPLARYEILNYQHLENGSYSYVQVGNWVNDTFYLDIKKMQLPENVQTIKSVCSEMCSAGYYKVLSESNRQNRTCCWSCISCKIRQISNGEFCKSCPKGFLPNAEKTNCLKMNFTLLQWNHPEMIASVTLSGTGILLTTISAFVFFIYHSTPVVKSSTKELCFIMFIGMILSHSCVLFIEGKPTWRSCTLLKIVPGLALTMMYSALLVKTNRISRILSMSKKRFPKLRLRCISTHCQVLICFILIVFELVICYIYLIIEPVEVVVSVIQNNKNTQFDKAILECRKSNSRQELYAPFAFNFVLLALCTLYAFKTRNLPDNFNEAKFIGFSCYATLITWAAFLCVYISSFYEELSLVIFLSITALINLMFLFFPKLYIIFWRPERNTRAHFATNKSIRCHIGNKDLANVCYSLKRNNSLRNCLLYNISNIAIISHEIQKCIESHNAKEFKPFSCQNCINKLKKLRELNRRNSNIHLPEESDSNSDK